MIEIKRLQQHVAEFGVADADIAVFHAGTHAFLGHHHVDREMLADIAQKIEERHRRGPRGVIDETGGVGGNGEIEQLRELHLNARDVGTQHLGGEQGALG